MASLTSGTEIALIVAVAVSIVLAVSRLTRSAALASPAFGSGFKVDGGVSRVQRVLGRVLQPQDAAFGPWLRPWLRRHFDTWVAGFRVDGNTRTPFSFATIFGANVGSVTTSARAAHQKRTAAVAAQSPRLTADMQWDRVSRTVAGAVDGVALVRTAQGTAAIKLDAADYELERLLNELGGVMKLRSRSAEVAEFPLTYRARSLRQSGARVAA